jgi:sortase A
MRFDDQRARPGRLFRILKVVQYMLIVTGVGLLGYACATLLSSKYFQAVESANLSKALLYAHAGPPRVRWTDGATIGRLEIPRLGLSTIIVEGDGKRDLKRAAGHIPGTAFPGQPGNAAVAAHRDTFFRPLRSIRANDEIIVDTLEGSFKYRVSSTKIVGPKQNRVLYPTSEETLTLVTCYPFSFVGPAPERFIVRAKRVAE